jgi:NAD(P)-dependent dehydrogenase (short-subunit alcohol dehydrogenase family)
MPLPARIELARAYRGIVPDGRVAHFTAGFVAASAAEARRIALAAHPIGRLGTASDIAKGIVFLASDDAGFMTGAGLVVDGGYTAQ